MKIPKKCISIEESTNKELNVVEDTIKMKEK